MHYRDLSIAVCFAFLLSLYAASAQESDVKVLDGGSDFDAFNLQEKVFEKICSYEGSDPQFSHLEWLLNGAVNYSNAEASPSSRTTLSIFTRQVDFSYVGNWTCRAVFSGGRMPASVNGGIVTVYDPNDITAPPQQYALFGQSFRFNCSSVIPNSFVSWIRGTEQPVPITTTLPPLQLSDEQLYMCRVSVASASIELPVQLNVIVPPRIFTFPNLNGQIFGNQQLTLSVTFQSHQQNTTLVRWYINDTLIRSNNTITIYGPAPNATTSISFSPIARENRGTYRVEVENTADILTDNMRMAEATFDVAVRVPPSLPTGIMFTALNNTHAMIRWTLTNQTPDAGAETLSLHLQNHPNSPFELEPTQSEWILYSEPGITYNLSLKVSNPDGVVATNPMTVGLPPTAPEVETFRALRVNSTAFNFTLQVTYTGGGDIVEFAVRLRENGQSTFVPLDTLVPQQSRSNPRVWYAVLMDEQFARLVDPEFQVITRNFLGQSTSEPVQGEDVVPGPPSVILSSSSSNSLSLQVRVSDYGTAPIQFVQMNVSLGSRLITTQEWRGDYVQGDLLDVTVTGLEANTVYTCRTRAVNAVGMGNISMNFNFTTGESSGILPQWGIIAIAVAGSVILATVVVTTILCCVYCCRSKGYGSSGKYNTNSHYVGASVMSMPEELKRSSETLNSASHRGSVRGGVVGAYTQVNVPFTPRSPTIESCDSPYTKQRFESVTDSDGSRSDIHIQNPHFPRHYTYSHSPGPSGITPNLHAHVPNPLSPIKMQMNDRLSKSLTAFDEPTSPQSVSHHATMV